MELFGDVQVLLSDGTDGCAGMLTSCELLDKKVTIPGQLCEVVLVSESSVEGEAVYNVIWIEWEENLAHRKGVGRVLKSAWRHKSLNTLT